MSRRFYLPSAGAPPLAALAYGAGWNKTSQASRFALQRTPSDTADLQKLLTSSIASPEFHCGAQYQSPALAGQTISGTLKGQIRAFVNNVAFNGTIAVSARVVSSDGTVIRGELFGSSTPHASQAATSPPRIPLSTTNRRFKDASENTDLALTPVDCIAGDILVFEVGARDVDTGTSRSATLRLLDPLANTDLPEDETTTTSTTRPWVEFSFDILFADEVPTPDVNTWLNGSWDVLHVLKRRFRRITTRVSKRDS